MGSASGNPGAKNNGNGPKTDLEILDSAAKSHSEAHKDAHAVLDDETVTELSIAIELVTSDPSVNNRNPAILHLPLASDDEEYTVDNGGVLMALVVDHGDDRVPIQAMGITREEAEDEISTQSSDGTEASVEMKVFGENETSGLGLLETTADTPAREDSVSTQSIHGSVGCEMCTTIIATACVGSSRITQTSCAKAAVSAGAFNPWAGGAAAAFCLYVVQNATTLTCTAAPGTICVGAGICD
ncbi:hypothetical protein Natoc_1531 [Natronococcus occultus SP4]|uniref:Halocin C8 n=2 Tax=Natronococcus occultus TaxID=29288 RepID=L0JZR0_9EURY|nr:hypothetical protein Natoc_1531 [Natronococcus occultus SP4]